MGRRERSKGLRGENEVRHVFTDAGYTVRGLDGKGDNLVMCGAGLMLHLETKRQEKVRLPEWARQAAEEAPPGAVPLVVWRPSRALWRVDLELADFVEILLRAS